MNHDHYDEPKPNNFMIYVYAAALLVAAGILAWMLFSEQAPSDETAVSVPVVATEPPSEEPTPPPPADPTPTVEASEPPPVTEPEQPNPAAVESTPLPTLEASDEALRKELATPSGALLLPLLADEFVLRKAVRAILALAEGGLVHQHRPLKEPSTPFAATTAGGLFRIDPSNYLRYQLYLNAFEAIGAEQLVMMYERYYPLLEEAYRELGVTDKGSFRAVTHQALDALLVVPDAQSASLLLTRRSVMYKFQDSSVESLNGAQRLKLRIGPDGSQRLNTLLTDIKGRLRKQ